ncbi:MAG TPA: hypothetical protein VF165_20340 [Nocardioidaceae bacterium]
MSVKLSDDDVRQDVTAQERPVWRRALPHLLFLLVLAAGVVLRWLAQRTYVPAIIYSDSEHYLANSVNLVPGGFPLGYSILVKLAMSAVSDLAVLPLLNHLFGLVMGGLLYVALLRRGVSPWLAALGAAPVLLDAYQLFLEQMVMSDVLFQVAVVAGTVALLWNRRPGLPAAAVCGVSFAAAALTRDVGPPLVLAGALYCLLATGSRGRRLATTGLLVVTFVVPMAAAVAYASTVPGEIGPSSEGGARKLYARAASVADCDALRLPEYERVLCPPPETVEPHFGSRLEGYKVGVAGRLTPPPGMSATDVYYDFMWRVVRHQPLDVARAVGATFVRPFTEWGRSRGEDELPIDRWRFSAHRGEWNASTPEVVDRWGGSGPSTDVAKARLLRRYQLSVGYTPGPVLLAGLVLGVAGALGLGRAGRSGQRMACLLWVVVGAGLLLSADLYLFSWRYQLPALVTLPPAGVLGLTALLGGGRYVREAQGGQVDRAQPVTPDGS